MTDHAHAATGPGPGSGPRPTPGVGPQDAAPAAATPPTEKGEPRAPEHAATDDQLPIRFRRDRRQKMLGGVCAGLGRACDMDPVIFRITLAVLSATGGIGLIFYGFAWLFVPYDDEEENEVRKLLTGRVDGQALTAVLFALVGCGVFLTMLKNGGVLSFAVILSILLAGAGYWSRNRGAPDPDPLAAQAVADAPPEAKAPPVPSAYPSWWRDPIVKDGTHVGGTGYLWGPSDTRDRDIAAAVNITYGNYGGPHPGIRTPWPSRPKPRGARWIGGWVFLLALLAGFLGTAARWDDAALATSLQTGLACALIVFGVGIAVSAFLGRTGAGSIFLAIITAALLAGSAALPKDVSTHWVRTEWTPTAVADVLPRYDLGTGVATLDLTGLRLAKGQTVTTAVEVGVGRIEVIVPKDVTVEADIEVGIGDIQLPGEGKQDVDVAPGKHKQVTLPPADEGSAGTVDLDLGVGVGQAEVTRAAS
ncbi:PspC domain-containing protein [Streptomyces sp. WI04-05B]|uniref:PspC domain-containing protein n=1 Tax=Streptomyces TaxID=1883 RepID=UPI0029AA58FB|nr:MULTISPECIES: PspC domain-containing protein [unclassified Streptomyces]MDX2543927.1 PspC domain-containing protein [Streptomyces sp. WI04-05B]MDX2584363.1 PspC domain-containing protein [Streptomyces sp. WI04-05A]MDX3753077.1 PspC domain-containing protein [Streptomyces sp. AK08-02]